MTGKEAFQLLETRLSGEWKRAFPVSGNEAFRSPEIFYVFLFEGLLKTLTSRIE